MGLVFGKISVETPKYNVIQTSPEYEIREYPPTVSAEITYDPSDFKGNKDGGFKVLAEYIGVFGVPKNTKPEKIAMTSPVITKSSETIAMTSPVLTKDEGGKSRMVTMQFLLPSKYTSADEAPKPTDERVVIKEEGSRKYGVVTFNGAATDEVVKEKVEKLRSGLEKDGFRIAGDFVLARFNPPWTIPRFKTNEVMIPVQ